ncbi:YggT family protein [Marispirochaeta aestuarii]|uniref:YggT family protein n=1 Tax=Marispirochaeta aestuarii TaxID=1963862 RepID=UPI0029C649DA|nr:YggT family protein [Marispirochaeta aestuarii]
MQQVMRFISGALSVYMILIFIRVLMTWFQGANYGRAMEILRSVTDPYLYWFRRFPFLRAGSMDFSPLAALIVLVIILNITNRLALTGSISLGIVLAIIVGSIWGAVGWVLTFFFILVLIRFITLLFRASMVSPFIQTLDIIIAPILRYFSRVILRGQNVTYQTGLALSGAILLLTRLLGNLVFYQIQGLLASLPF